MSLIVESSKAPIDASRSFEAFTMDIRQLLAQMGGGGGGQGMPDMSSKVTDSAETVQISSLALLKMLKHGACRAAPSDALVEWHNALARSHSAACAHAPPPLLLPLSRDIIAPLGRLGIPMEVMGLMLGTFVDDYTVSVVDVFAMPQSGSGVSVEAVDEA
jgi:26S proteasome regulatory subunit N11